jgi:DNA-binding NarL/FixJ family response regulator
MREGDRMTDGAVVRVLLVDDDDDVRAALAEVIDDDPRFEVVAAGRDVPDALRLALEHRPHLVLLDVRMPGGGVSAAQALRKDAPDRVLVGVSAHADVSTVEQMLRAGVVGFFTKGQLGADLTDKLHLCVRGHVVLAAESAATALRRVLATS